MEKKRFIKILIYVMLVTFILSGCQPLTQTGKKDTEQDQETQIEEVWSENPIPEEERKDIEGSDQMGNAECEMFINAISPSEPLNLTTEQKLEDFDFFWNKIQEKVYCLEDILAEVGIDYEESIAEFREEMSKSQNDYEFYKILNDSAQMVRGNWHVKLVMPYTALLEGITLSKTIGQIKETDGDETDHRLKYWDVLLVQNDMNYRTNRRSNGESGEMPELKIIDEKTAMITLPTFYYSFQREEAGDLLIEYMKQVSDYENVIFDMKGNRGGINSFFYDNLIAPNIDEPLTYTIYPIFKMAEELLGANMVTPTDDIPGEFRLGYKGIKNYPSEPISKLPEEEKGDFGNADHFMRYDRTVFPRYDHKILDGKLWLLTYPENYSSAEEFAISCKKTGFATLVGKQTKGDGGAGIMSLRFDLPNSGLPGSVQCVWTLNEDGTSNMEEGTKPDIESPEGETPLETCLRVIGESEKQ